METSILKSTKKILGLAEDYTAFDLDVITHINATLAIVHQLGVGPTDGLYIQDETASWDDLNLPQDQLGMVRTYIFLRVRMLFDPPTTSFVIDAVNKQIEEFETRLSYLREDTIPLPVPTEGGGW